MSIVNRLMALFALTIALLICSSVILLGRAGQVFSEINDGVTSTVHAVEVGLVILFFVAIILGSAAIGVKIWKMASSHTIRDGNGDKVARAVIYKGAVVQIGSAEGIGLAEILQMQAQLVGQQQKTLQVVDSGARAIHRMLPLLSEQSEEDEDEGDTDLPDEPKVYALSEQLQASTTQINEETSIVGYVDDEPLRGKLFDDDGNMFDSVFVLGDPGFGKSTFATYLSALTVLHHGRLIVIDPDAEFGQSLSVRLGALSNEIFLLCPIADTPEKAARAVNLARDEIESPSDYPVIWLIDEFSMIARQATSGNGKWAEVGKDLIDLTEDWATRGRKRRRRVVAFGQIPNRNRTGGTEFRDSCTVISFHLKKKRAQMVLEEEAEIAPYLGAGEVIVIPARSSESSYRMQLPYPDSDGLRMIAQTMAKMASENSSDGSEYAKGSELEPLSNHTQIALEPLSNRRPEPFFVDHETAFKVKVRRMRDMHNQGKNQSQIIEAIYGVKKGGSPEYAKARDEYLSIMQLLASTEGEF
jgi:hypothetical protein